MSPYLLVLVNVAVLEGRLDVVHSWLLNGKVGSK